MTSKSPESTGLIEEVPLPESVLIQGVDAGQLVAARVVEAARGDARLELRWVHRGALEFVNQITERPDEARVVSQGRQRPQSALLTEFGRHPAHQELALPGAYLRDRLVVRVQDEVGQLREGEYPGVEEARKEVFGDQALLKAVAGQPRGQQQQGGVFALSAHLLEVLADDRLGLA